MSTVAAALDRWLELKTKHGADVSTRPGASEEEIAEAEETLGFNFCDEARDLFRHSNGVVSTQTLFPVGHYFEPLSNIEAQLSWKKMILDWIPDYGDERYESLPGAPSKPLLIFQGQHGIGLECGPIGTGAVIHLDDELGFYWIARSLTEYLNRLCDYDTLGLITWEEGGTGEVSESPGGIAREPEHQNKSPHWGKWRWE